MPHFQSTPPERVCIKKTRETPGSSVHSHLSVSSSFYLLCYIWCVSALPQLDLSVGEAQLPQTGQLLLPILQGLELG